jgi:hypothetical protein
MLTFLFFHLKPLLFSAFSHGNAQGFSLNPNGFTTLSQAWQRFLRFLGWNEAGYLFPSPEQQNLFSLFGFFKQITQSYP